MPTQTWAQSNQTKTVIEVLACAQTKNKLRPRQGKRLTDHVNLQSRDRSVFECFLTLLHREGKLCFCLLSCGSLKHKCCENEELGCWEVKANMCYKGQRWKMSGKWVIWFQCVETCWSTGLATFFCFSLQCIHSLPDIQTGKKMLSAGMALPSQKKYPITEDVVDDSMMKYTRITIVLGFFLKVLQGCWDQT